MQLNLEMGGCDPGIVHFIVAFGVKSHGKCINRAVGNFLIKAGYGAAVQAAAQKGAGLLIRCAGQDRLLQFCAQLRKQLFLGTRAVVIA